jgi:tetratricopeptide (TPR) repeat protein
VRKQAAVSVLSFDTLAVIVLATAVVAQNSPADHFANGKKLVEDNCVDCMGGTREGEEAAIQELEAAVQAHQQPVEAYKLMAEAYANLTTYAKSETESQGFRDKEYDIYRKLYQLASDDPQVLMQYAQTLADAKQQIPIYQKLVSLDPNNSDGRFSLGDALLQQNQVKEGVEQIKQAVTLGTDPEAIRNYVQRLIGVLEQHQCPLKGAAAFNREVVRAEEAATRGEGDPKPMALFKKKFAAALAQHECEAATSASAQPQ